MTTTLKRQTRLLDDLASAATAFTDIDLVTSDDGLSLKTNRVVLASIGLLDDEDVDAILIPGIRHESVRNFFLNIFDASKAEDVIEDTSVLDAFNFMRSKVKVEVNTVEPEINHFLDVGDQDAFYDDEDFDEDAGEDVFKAETEPEFDLEFGDEDFEVDDEDAFRPPPRKARKLQGRRSRVWKYFNKSDHANFNTCILCSRLISGTGGSTSTMRNHLMHKHPDAYEDIRVNVFCSDDEDADVIKPISAFKTSTVESKPRSRVWKYFQTNEDESAHVCQLCHHQGNYYIQGVSKLIVHQL